MIEFVTECEHGTTYLFDRGLFYFAHIGPKSLDGLFSSTCVKKGSFGQKERVIGEKEIKNREIVKL